MLEDTTRPLPLNELAERDEQQIVAEMQLILAVCERVAPGWHAVTVLLAALMAGTPLAEIERHLPRVVLALPNEAIRPQRPVAQRGA